MVMSEYTKRDLFKTDDRVSYDIGDGQTGTGTVLGLSYDHVIQMFIVGLDEPIMNAGRIYKAITVPASLMKRLSSMRIIEIIG